VKKTLSALVALATVVTAVPATLAIPEAANAAVRVVVGPGGAYYWGGRHWRHRRWRGGRWYYYDPIVIATPRGVVVGGPYYYGGRRWGHRQWVCHYNPHRGRVCKYRYW
jgi:hypothetical protein